ncbi:MAG: hypothetical protein QXP74_00065 [Nitrososphaerota archaeon]
MLQAVGTVPGALSGIVTEYSPTIGGVVQPNAFIVKLYSAGAEYSGTVQSMAVLLGAKG